MKIARKIVKVLLWIAGIVVALVLALPLWVGLVVKPVANAVVSSKTGTAFRLGEFGMNQYSGRLTVGDVQLENPEGCSQKMAATLGKLHVDVDMGTVTSDTIVIEDVTLKDVFVSYVSNGKGESNFAVIQRNAAGEPKVKAKGEGEQRSDKLPTSQTSQTPQTPQTSKKVIIDHLLVEGVLVQLGPMPMRLPKIELNGIGRKSQGVTLAEAWNQIYAAVTKSMSDLGVNVNDLVKSLGNASLEQALKTLDAVKAVDVKRMTDALKGGTGLVNDAAGKTVGAVSGSANKAVDAVNETTGKAVDAVSEGAGKAVDAVNESTGKAVDALKGLFK